jgi:hypothetical protein
MEDDNKKVVEALTLFRNKAFAWQCQDRVPGLLSGLKALLEPDEYLEVSTSHSHFSTGEGAKEGYAACNDLIRKYRRGLAGGTKVRVSGTKSPLTLMRREKLCGEPHWWVKERVCAIKEEQLIKI